MVQPLTIQEGRCVLSAASACSRSCTASSHWPSLHSSSAQDCTDSSKHSKSLRLSTHSVQATSRTGCSRQGNAVARRREVSGGMQTHMHTCSCKLHSAIVLFACLDCAHTTYVRPTHARPDLLSHYVMRNMITRLALCCAASLACRAVLNGSTNHTADSLLLLQLLTWHLGVHTQPKADDEPHC